jgi:hypothetical protein
MAAADTFGESASNEAVGAAPAALAAKGKEPWQGAIAANVTGLYRELFAAAREQGCSLSGLASRTRDTAAGRPVVTARTLLQWRDCAVWTGSVRLIAAGRAVGLRLELWPANDDYPGKDQVQRAEPVRRSWWRGASNDYLTAEAEPPTRPAGVNLAYVLGAELRWARYFCTSDLPPPWPSVDAGIRSLAETGPVGHRAKWVLGDVLDHSQEKARASQRQRPGGEEEEVERAASVESLLKLGYPYGLGLVWRAATSGWRVRPWDVRGQPSPPDFVPHDLVQSGLRRGAHPSATARQRYAATFPEGHQQ